MFDKSNKQPGYLAGILEFIILLIIVFLIRTFFFGLYQVPSGSMETTMLIGERFVADKFTYNFRNPRRGEVVAFNDPTYNYSKKTPLYLFQQYVWGPSNWTKRVVGLPGEEIKGVIENGKAVIYVNDKKLEEPYLNKYPLLWVYSYPDSPRSYDASVPYEKQPFYRIKESDVMPEQLVREMYHQTQPIQQDAPYVSPYAQKVGQDRIDNKQSFWDGSDLFYIKLGPNQYWLMGDNRRGSKDSRYLGPIEGNLIHGRIVWRIWSIDSNESWWILDLLQHPIDFWKRIRWSRFFQFVS